MKDTNLWSISYDNFEPTEEGLREALCTLGNGYFGTRGAAPESGATKIHYPGTYIAGLYNRLTTHIAGRNIVNEDLVNCPNWLCLTFKIGDSEWFYPATSKLLSYKQELNMKKGMLRRALRFQNSRGQITQVITERIVHIQNPHVGAMRYVVKPENYDDWITVRTMINGSVLNTGVERYRQLNNRHWVYSSGGTFAKNGIFLCMKTSQSKIEACEASKIRIFSNKKEIKPTIKHLVKDKERNGQEFKIYAKCGRPYEIEKTVAIFTSQDFSVRYPKKESIKMAKNLPRFSELLKTHQQVWEERWKKFDIIIEGDNFAQKVLRLHMFHLLQVATHHNKDIDAGIPARGLHGEAYRGHIFWDEMYTMAFYDFHNPDISRSVILYRYRRLGKAREYAKKFGYKGAMFPWQSGSSGREETQVVHLNPMSGKWGPDYSSAQRHINFAIAHNVWKHWERTNDFEFLKKYGAEVLLSIAQFCASLAKYNSKDNRYHIKGVMGPDEFHEKYPNSKEAGVEDNAYTNFMVTWILLRAQDILKMLSEKHKRRIVKKIKLVPDELIKWDRITRKMNLIINDEGVISQFKGYMKLKELDWEGYRSEYGKIERLDRILKAEGRSPDSYKLSKQADVLMIFYLFSLPEIGDIFTRLGYKLTKNMPRKNYDYYLRRTSHGSTLSKVVHCFIAYYLGKKQGAWHWFREVLKSDIHDTQGGTTPEGIHCGVMGGSIDIVMRGFAGIRIVNDRIQIDPNLPKFWNSLKLKFQHRGKWISMEVTREKISIFIHGTIADSMLFEINGKLRNIVHGKLFVMKLRK
ncbi:MAG: glycoside hydrolase family 65 protein [Endomicrobiales bacterium]|nr:glycoside hydrolase family 65 protein [Endomicrobiales bacterium]